jgi:hypothetical protein
LMFHDCQVDRDRGHAQHGRDKDLPGHASANLCGTTLLRSPTAVLWSQRKLRSNKGE